MNKGPSTLQQCAKRPDLAGRYAGENSGGVPPRPLFVELAAGCPTSGMPHQGERAVRRAPSSACVLLVHILHGPRPAPVSTSWSEGCWGLGSRALFLAKPRRWR